MRTKFAAIISAALALLFAPAHAAQPKLIIGILVDQLRYDYLERFHDQFVDGGFKLLTDKGTFLTYAHYNYVPTTTAPGHASAFSGTTPASHGIIGNDWFDKRTRKMMNCVSDPSVTGVGAAGTGGKSSPRNFIGSNFADELRLRFQSKVVGISMKDRGAILPAGKKPLGAYWFESKSGHFITSTYYTSKLPAWVAAFNDRKRPYDFLDKNWERLLKPEAYERADDLPGEAALPGESRPIFPHLIERVKPASEAKDKPKFEPVTDLNAPLSPIIQQPEVPHDTFDLFVPSPFSNQVLAEFAEAAIEGEHLGEGPGPDLLTVSFSAIDACGHRFGPYSQEVQDITLRLDRQLAEFFQYVDKKVGLDNCVIFLTADHGVMPPPDFAAQEGLDGQRANDVLLMGDLASKLGVRFGSANVLLARRIVDGNIYFNYDFLREKNIAPADVASFVRDWALATGKYQACYTREQLLDGRAPGANGQRLINGFNAERSGDVVLLLKPFIIPWGVVNGTTHGSPYSYDTHVPVLFHGPLFKPGRYADDFQITDLVPTLCNALHMNEPAGCIGKPLVRVLAEP
jgi:predicted AlkP superfamily pyrophosphatase or phosphodiesterase